MDKQFFERKVRDLSDDKLQDLLKLRNDANREIIELAIEEAKKRGRDLPEVSVSGQSELTKEQEDRKELEKWNWGAFLLAPFWTLSNKLEKWTILTFIPGVNLAAVIYLGLYGNRLAYDKSDIRNMSILWCCKDNGISWPLEYSGLQSLPR